MRRQVLYLRVLSAIMMVMGAVETANAQWGTLSGRVIVTGDIPEVPPLYAKGDPLVKEPICRARDIADESLVIDAETKGLANVLLFLSRAPDAIPPELAEEELEPLVFDQKDCRFVPHVMVIRTNQTVLVKSDDPVLHNAHTYPTFNSPQNVPIQPREREGLPFSFRQREPSPMQVKCDIHPWMTAWWLVVDHPYATASDKEGEFTIDKLPAGEHSFRVWHERAKWIEKSLKVEIRDGEITELPPIEVPADTVIEN